MPQFDPCYEWLGIPQEEQPPDHYRLLGLRRYEANPVVIENAAARQMAHLKLFQAGPRSMESQRLLNQVAQARVCLLNAKSRAEYDARLHKSTPTHHYQFPSGVPSNYPDGREPVLSPAAAFIPEREEGIPRTTTPARRLKRLRADRRATRNSIWAAVKVFLGGAAGIMIAVAILHYGFEYDLRNLLSVDRSAEQQPAPLRESATMVRSERAEEKQSEVRQENAAKQIDGDISQGEDLPSNDKFARPLSPPQASDDGLDGDRESALVPDSLTISELTSDISLRFEKRWNVIGHETWNSDDITAPCRFRIAVAGDQTGLGARFPSTAVEFGPRESLTLTFAEADEIKLTLENTSTDSSRAIRYGLTYEHPNFKTDLSTERIDALRRNWERDLRRSQRQFARDRQALEASKQHRQLANRLPADDPIAAGRKATEIVFADTKIANFQNKVATQLRRIKYLEDRLKSLPVLVRHLEDINDKLVIRVEVLMDSEVTAE